MSSQRSFPRRFALVVALAGLSAPASAAFFQIAENSASGIGNAFAGGAAVAEDASTVWYNPAGMTRLKDAQLVVGGHYIRPSFKASVNSASTALGSIGGGGGNAGESALVPNLYATYPVTSRLALGAGINAPFGLATNYDDTWAGRYYALRSDIKTVNFNLAGAFKFHDTLSAGVGVNRQRLDAELTQAVDFATLCTGVILIIPGAGACGLGGGFSQPNNPNDGKARVTAKGDAWGSERQGDPACDRVAECLPECGQRLGAHGRRDADVLERSARAADQVRLRPGRSGEHPES